VVQSLRPVPNKPKSGLVQVDLDIWTIEAEKCVCYRPPMQPSYPYTHRAVVLRLNDGSLFILSPVQLTPDIRIDIDTLGIVKYLVSPNHLHHLYLGDWGQAYPDAKLYASPGLAPKRKDLTFYKILSTNTPEPEWAGQIDQCMFGSGNGWFDEIVFFHRASRTLIFTDMVMDFDPANFSSLSRVTTRWNQMYQHTPRGVQFAHIFDKASLRNSLETVRTWKPKYIIVAHSPWLCVEGEDQVTTFLDSAFDWLKPQPPVVESILNMAWLLMLLMVILPIHALIVLAADIAYPRLIGRDESS
jgi:Domain of unknown function (DUF4336)